MEVLRSSRPWLIGGYILLLATAGWILFGKQAFASAAAVRPSVISEAGPAGSPFIGIVFRLEDCGASVEALTAWNRERTGDGPLVLGFVVETPDDTAVVRGTLAGSGIDFPLYTNPEQDLTRMLRAMGHVRTPVAVVFDDQHRIRMAVPLRDGIRPEEVQRVISFAYSLGSGRDHPSPPETR